MAQRVDEYREELKRLYQQMEGWLPESAETDRIDAVFEFWDGHYSATFEHSIWRYIFARNSGQDKFRRPLFDLLCSTP